MIPEYIQLTEILQKTYPNFNPSIIFDVGSRECNESIEFSKKYPNATVYSFEPNPDQYAECVKNISEYPNIKFNPIALSDKIGEFDFCVTPGNIGVSSLLTPKYIPFASTQYYYKTKVPVTTLDTWTSENSIYHIDLLWMDVQGNELNVLKGATNILKNTFILNTEVGLQAYYEGHTMRNDIVPFLENLGFKLIHEKPEWDAEANVIFINQNFNQVSI